MAFKYKGLRLKDPSLMKKLRQVPLTFTRASVAYDYKGDAVGVNTPRFQHLINGKMEYGCQIEEAHTNILPASQSQSLSEAYTTAALNGTYTFQCEGTGSYTLSGGATGTVSKDNPVIAAVSSATVTLTPTETSTLNQVLLKPYPLSWTLGGTTQSLETLTAPSSVLNIDTSGGTPNNGSLTIEMEAYLPSFTQPIRYLFGTSPLGTNSSKISMQWNETLWDVRSYNAAQNISRITSTTPKKIGWNKFAYAMDSTKLAAFINASEIGTPVTSPNLPSAKSSWIWFGDFLGLYQSNMILRNITITGTNRSNPDITRRAGQASPSIDKETKLIAPLIRDLKAYRVRT